MAMVAPYKVKEAQPSRPGTVGLLQSLGDQVRYVDDLELRGGVTFLPEACGPGGTNAPCSAGTQWVSDASPTVVESNAFIIWAGDKCSAFGSIDRDFDGRARRALESMQSYLVEYELWTGTVAKAQTPDWPNNYLASHASDMVGSETVGISPLNALACLEKYLGDALKGRDGMIHVSREVITYWASMGLVERDGSKVTSKALGTTIVAGSGYPGTDPNGNVSDGNVWSYATSPILVEMGPIQIFGGNEVERTIRDTNDIEVVAARLVTITWDGCAHGAAKIDMDTCMVGGS